MRFVRSLNNGHKMTGRWVDRLNKWSSIYGCKSLQEWKVKKQEARS